MTSRSRMVTILAVLAFVAFLLCSTLSSQRSSARWRSSSRVAGRPRPPRPRSEDAAARQAQTAACGPMARGHEREHRLRPAAAGQPHMPHAVSERVPRIRFPHPLALLVSCILLAAALTWILPAGRSTSAAKTRPPAGASSSRAPTHPVPATPVGPFDALVAIPKGMVDAGLGHLLRLPGRRGVRGGRADRRPGAAGQLAGPRGSPAEASW